MVQIIEENRRPQRQHSPSAADRLKNALAYGIGVAGETYVKEHERKENEQKREKRRSAASEYLDMDLPEGLGDEDLREILKSGLIGKRESELQREKYEFESGKDIREKTAPFKNALSVIDKMRQLRKKGNLGILSSVQGLWNPETLKDKGEYETLGNSLIQFASSIPIRNKQEFEKLAGHLGDPNITDARAEGILNAMEELIQGNLNQYQMGEEEESVRSNVNTSKKPPLTSFIRK